MLFKRIALTTLAALSLQLTADAQTRPQRRAPARPAAKPTAATPRPAAASAAQAGVTLTARDMALLVDGLGFPPEARAQLAASAEERRAFARDIRQMLAAAEEAKAAGYLARPELKLQSELARALVIADAYAKQRQDAGATTAEQVVAQAEIDAYLKEPATAARFEEFVQDYTKNSPERGAPVTAEKRRELQQYYGRVMVAMRKGVAAGLDRERKTQLVAMLRQSRLLAVAYSKEVAPRLKATDAEIAQYIAAHPELDASAARAKIERVLARARAGEDFVKLANEFTEDPSGKGRGGDLGWFGRGMMVKPFEDTAFALKPGEVSGVFETQFGFHIVKLDGRRPQGSGVEVHARHILIMYPSAARAPNSPPMSPRDRARSEVESEKRERMFDGMAARRRVQVAEDYTVGERGATTATTPPAAARDAKTNTQTNTQPKTPAGRATKPPAPKRPPAKRGQ